MKITFNANSRNDNEISRISVTRGIPRIARAIKTVENSGRFRSKIIFPTDSSRQCSEKLNARNASRRENFRGPFVVGHVDD